MYQIGGFPTEKIPTESQESLEYQPSQSRVWNSKQQG